jgi:hypothetical protein
MLSQLGFPPDRFHILINRLDRRNDIGLDDLEKLFGCKIHARLPNDYFSLHRVVTLGQPLGAEGELGRAIESVATRLYRSMTPARKAEAPAELRPAYSV